MINTSK